MKRVVRHNVFETNSSSTHSVSISKKLNGIDAPGDLVVSEEDNKVHARFGEFGWEVRDYRQASTKLSYYLTMMYESCVAYENSGCNRKEFFNVKSYDDFRKIPYFIELETLIACLCECDGLEIDFDNESDKYKTSDGGRHLWKTEGYIDHQSCEEYLNPREFLNEYGVTLEEFIFDPAVILHTDNDNR